jgi:hypothetical protein
MMDFTFGVGVAILMHREQFEIEHDKVDVLMQAIDAQTKVCSSLIGHLPTYIDQIQKDLRGDLRKLSVSKNLGTMLTGTKGLMASIHKEIGKLAKLQSECRAALERAALELPDCAKFITNGRHDTVPNRIMFQMEKGGTAAQLQMSGTKHPSVLASLSDTQLARRFSK